MSGLLFSEPPPPSLPASGAAQQQDSRKALVNVTCGDNNLVLSIPLSIHPVVQTFLSHDYMVGTSVPLVTGSDLCASLEAKVFSEARCLSWQEHLN